MFAKVDKNLNSRESLGINKVKMPGTCPLSPILLVFSFNYLVRVSGQFLQQIVGCSRWIDAYPVLG